MSLPFGAFGNRWLGRAIGTLGAASAGSASGACSSLCSTAPTFTAGTRLCRIPSPCSPKILTWIVVGSCSFEFGRGFAFCCLPRPSLGSSLLLCSASKKLRRKSRPDSHFYLCPLWAVRTESCSSFGCSRGYKSHLITYFCFKYFSRSREEEVIYLNLNY